MVCLHDRCRKKKIEYDHPARVCHLLLLLSLLHTHSLLQSPCLSCMINTTKKKAQGGEIVLALKACFTLTHVSGRLSPSECLTEHPPPLSLPLPPLSQQSNAARQSGATAQSSRLWKASMHTIAEEGEGEFGVAGEGEGKRERGRKGG